MSVTTSQPGSSERSPLLSNGKSTQSISNYDAARGPVLQVESRPERGTETGSSSLQDDADDDDEEAVPDMTPEQRRKSLYRWLGFWFLVAVIVGLLVWQAFNRGGGEFDWKGALKKAGGGGVAGALAMILQVLTLMPLRTIMNFQYRFGGTMAQSTKKLYAEGGMARYYHGLGPALFQGPIARFGDTAANAGILALLSSNPFLAQLPSPIKTIFSSTAGALFRMILVPVDTLKTTMQTQGKPGVTILKERIKAYGIGTLWYGAFATAAASFVGSFPWFATYNFLSANLPPPHSFGTKLLRQAFIGFCASCISDCVSNSLRVIKTYRQVNRSRIGYSRAAKRILAAEGWKGLFGRGLKTRILANGLQSILFSILWKVFQDLIDKRTK